jgi:chemotaxis signal transduction protein
MRTQEKSLGELLRQAGKITSRQIQVALGEQKKSHEPIGKILVRLGFVEERDILQVMQGMMVLTFRVENEFFGIETFRIREVLKDTPFSPWTPDRPPWEGEVTLRGEKLPVLSFRDFLGLGKVSKSGPAWFVVLEKGIRHFALRVDQVMEVTRLKVDQIEPLPPYLFGRKAEVYYCLGKIKESLYSILNPDKLTGEGDFLPPASEVDHAFPS